MNYVLLLPLLIAFAGIYLLLPRPKPIATLAGITATGSAIVLGGLLFFHRMENMAETTLFYSFSGVAILGGILMLVQKNPVHAALSFAMVVLSTCGLFLLNAAPFLMAATIIIYAGAIVVTFLFVIMLAHQAGQTGADHRSREPFLASLGGFILMASLIALADRSYNTDELTNVLTRVQALSEVREFDEAGPLLGNRTDEAGSTDLVVKLRTIFGLTSAIENLDEAEKDKNLAMVRDASRTIAVKIQRRQESQGVLTPPASLPLPSTVSSQGATPGKLPARNVAALGRALFTDYLIPVEMAGMLLLVATIGAIAIAGRRTGGLR